MKGSEAIVNNLLESDIDSPEVVLQTFEPRYMVISKVHQLNPRKTYWGGMTDKPDLTTGRGYWHNGPLEAATFNEQEAEANLRYLKDNYIRLGYSEERADAQVGIELMSPKLFDRWRKRREYQAAQKALRHARRQQEGVDPDDIEGTIRREIGARSEPIREVNVIGRRWFRRGPGTTYHSYDLFVNGKLLHRIDLAYGYGDQYLWNAFHWLVKNGYFEMEKNEPPWQTAERLGFKLNYEVTDVPRKRDL